MNFLKQYFLKRELLFLLYRGCLKTSSVVTLVKIANAMIARVNPINKLFDLICKFTLLG